MKIAGIITLVLAIILWVICVIGWSGSKSGYLIAYFLKYPTILLTAITIILFVIAAFKN